MIRFLRHHAKRFYDSEKGTATIEFAITFPAMLILMLSGIELGFVNMRHALLERAVDMTVRDIRLGTGFSSGTAELDHDRIRDIICARAGFIDNCATDLRLEMIQRDPRNWVDIPADADCIDKSTPVLAVRNFVNGQGNELMIIRACAKFDPVFPTSGLGASLHDSNDGSYALIAVSAFVQEPQ